MLLMVWHTMPYSKILDLPKKLDSDKGSSLFGPVVLDEKNVFEIDTRLKQHKCFSNSVVKINTFLNSHIINDWS